jgi:hypothetical protein
MAVQITTQIIDSDPTGNLNEYRAVLQHDADFPTGGTDALGNPIVVHHGTVNTVVIVAVDAPAFRVAVRANGNAWKASIVAMLAGKPAKIIGGLSVGDVIGPY